MLLHLLQFNPPFCLDYVNNKATNYPKRNYSRIIS
jgi:hypothetical protein